MATQASTVAAIQAARAAVAAIGTVVVPPPVGEVIAVTAAIKYQTMTGWETLAQGWTNNKLANAYDPTWKQYAATVANKAVNELGLNRVALPCSAGWANPTDYWSQYVAGTLTYLQWGGHGYEALDPNQHQTSEFDFWCDTVLVPMQQQIAARGERLYVSMCFGDWPPPTGYKFPANPTAYAQFAKFYIDRLKSKYGVTLDAFTIINEPENSSGYWTGAQIGAALVAMRKLFPALHLIAPGVSFAYNLIPYAQAIEAVPGAMAALGTLAYHVYQPGDYAAIQAFAKARGKQTAMTEYFDATVDTMLDAVLLGNASSFQKWSLAGKLPKNNPQSGYYLADFANPASPVIAMAPNTPQMAALMRYVRLGAVRVDAKGQTTRVAAFVNADGSSVVVIKSSGNTAVTVTGLKPGTYGRHTISASDVAADPPDVVVAANGSVALTTGSNLTTLYGKAGAPPPPPPPPPSPPPPPPPPPAGTIVKLGLNFGAVGKLPWAFGQTFARGHVLSSLSVVADCAEFQCIPWSYHDDGSVRDAHVAGYCLASLPGKVDVAMRLGSSPPVASPPFARSTLVDIQITVSGMAPGIATRKTICAGPVMLHEQVTARVDAQVAVVYEVRSFKNGETEIFTPVLENTGFLAASQPARVLFLKVVIGGAQTFNEVVIVRHHTRIPLVRGSQWSTWIGADPKVLPAHDGAYLCATESFPPYAVGPATIGIVPQSYAPNYIGESGPGMSDTGYSPHIGLLPLHAIYPLTTGGAKAWSYMMAESLSSGSWSCHFRDETTGEPPLPSKHPSRSWQVDVPNGSGGENSVGSYDSSHQPSFTYVAAKLTGWQYFIDEHLAWTLWNHFYQQPTIRQDAKGILRTDVGANQDRGAAWALRTLAQCISLLPPTHPHFPDLVYAWQSNMAFYASRVVPTSAYFNNLGVIAPYTSAGDSLYQGGDRGNSTAWWGSSWMQCMVTQALGYALQMRLPVGAQAQADNMAVFQFSAKLIVGLCGPKNWRRFGRYAMPWWPDGNQRPPGAWYPDFDTELVEYEKAKGLTAQSPAPGGALFDHSTNNPIDGQDWQQGFVSYPWPALVYAVMHKAPGADAALARVMSSSSWPLIAAAKQVPIWSGMMPAGIVHPGA